MNASDTVENPGKKSVCYYITHAARILYGLMFFAFGLMGLFMSPPKESMPEFAQALAATGYMIQMVAGTEALAGALLLINRFVPLALALLAPLIVNIVAFHVFLVPQGTGMAVVVAVLEIYLAWAYRRAFLPMLTARVTPACDKPAAG
jgi:uncharacterized membrane protein YphA (DoxX/SURF4 family)